MVQAPRLGGGGLLQPSARRGFHRAGADHRDPRLAVRARGSEAEGYLVAAFGFRVPLDRNDLGGLVGPIPGKASRRGFAELPARDRSGGSRSRRADWAPRWVPEWGKWSRVMVPTYSLESL